MKTLPKSLETLFGRRLGKALCAKGKSLFKSLSAEQKPLIKGTSDNSR